MLPFVRRTADSLRGVRNRATYPVSGFAGYLPFVSGKVGLEIGGPSASFRHGEVVPVYERAASIDNCDFSSDTVWAMHADSFVFDPKRAPGKSFFLEGSALTPIADASYDFLLSCHNLEHFANPLKALAEWKRVLRPGGALILLLPNYKKTFDHQRTPTTVEHLQEDFRCGMGEDDLTHLPEILARHDLSRDGAAGTPEQFRQRSEKNLENRCLHHHVFDENNSAAMVRAAGYTVLSVSLARPLHICLLAQTPAS